MTKPNKQEIWAHNALLGAAGMIKACLNRILRSTTATEESRKLALEILKKIGALTLSLKTRRDQE